MGDVVSLRFGFAAGFPSVVWMMMAVAVFGRRWKDFLWIFRSLFAMNSPHTENVLLPRPVVGWLDVRDVCTKPESLFSSCWGCFGVADHLDRRQMLSEALCPVALLTVCEDCHRSRSALRGRQSFVPLEPAICWDDVCRYAISEGIGPCQLEYITSGDGC